MLDYEMCKRLRDAGYPAWDDDKANTGAGVTQSNVFVRMTAVRTEPSLEELLDECTRLTDPDYSFDLAYMCGAWYCIGTDNQAVRHEVHALSPAEAAAELWIKLKERER